MKKTLLPLLISFAILPTASHADVQISAGNGVSILAINGKAVERGTLFSDTPDMKAPNGRTQLVAEYTAEISDSADDYLLEKSDTFVLAFSASDTSIQINAPEISSRYALKAFNDSGDWRVLNSDGQSISFDFGKLEKQGFQLARNYENELKEFNETRSEAALPELNIETHNFNQGTPAQTNTGVSQADQKMVGQMLQFWYEQASTETRNKFKSWIQSGQ